MTRWLWLSIALTVAAFAGSLYVWEFHLQQLPEINRQHATIRPEANGLLGMVAYKRQYLGLLFASQRELLRQPFQVATHHAAHTHHATPRGFGFIVLLPFLCCTVAGHHTTPTHYATTAHHTLHAFHHTLHAFHQTLHALHHTLHTFHHALCLLCWLS